MTSLKDQMKLLRDAGKGVVEGVKKVVEPFKEESVFIPGAVKGAKKIVDTVKSKIKKGDK